MEHDDPPDLRARIRAAINYGKLGRATAAKAMSVSTGHLDRYTADSRYTPNDKQLQSLADAAGLPFEFFTADFSRLREVVPPGRLMTATEPAIRRGQAHASDAARRLAGSPPASADSPADAGEARGDT